MNRLNTLLVALALCLSARAEWYQVKSVTNYNQIIAFKPNEPANEIKIRIENLENIEDIRMNRSKVLLSGESALKLAKDSLEGQLVWIENLREDSGIYVGNVFLSYEQVVRSFSSQRMVGGQTISPEIRTAIREIYKRMLRHLDTDSNLEDYDAFLAAHAKAATGQSAFSYDVCYTHDYLKGIFIYEALYWFKNEGQFLSPDVQKIFVTWMAQYQNAQDQRAKGLEYKIRDMVVRYKLYKDFLYEE